MATAVLEALIKSISESQSPLKKVLASVSSPDSQARLKTRFADQSSLVEVLVRDNTRVADEADLVLLAHNPYMLDNILRAERLPEALRGKLIISILGGVAREQIHAKLYGRNAETQAFIMLAAPNMAAKIGESMTVIAEPPPNVPSKLVQQTIWLFEKAGYVKFVPDSLFNLATVLVGACIALTTVAVDGILDAAVIEGMPRSQAQELASQCLLGTGKLLRDGLHPAVLRESISSPRGCTIRAICQLEKLNARSAFTESVKAAADHIEVMGGFRTQLDDEEN